MSSKNKAENKPRCDKSCCTSAQTTSVFIMNDDEDDNDVEMVKLKHPGSEKPAYFIFTKDNKKVYELFTFTDSFRSYFIEDKVKADGKLYLTTPVDPLLLALPYLASSIHCSPLDQLLRDDKFPDIERLVQCSALKKNISKVADKKGVSVFGYKYNEEKTLAWLQSKVDRVVEALRQNSVQVSSSNAAISNNFVKHSSEMADSAENFLKYGFGIVSEYLSNDLKQKLQSRLNISVENDGMASKRNRSASGDKETCNGKRSRVLPEEPPSPPTTSPPALPKGKTPTQSAKDKARAKAAVGSKSISSFFKKPA